MVWDELARDAEEANKKDRDRWIGVYIGILAVLLAVCSTGGSNASKDATLKNIEASNMWAFFQAKNVRRTSYQLAADDLELSLTANPAMPAEARTAIEGKVKSYRETVRRYTTDPEKKEGLDELFVRAKELEKERDIAMQKDPYFDYGEAFLQIAIVLASIALITGGSWLLVGSAFLGVLGTFLTFNGFTLMFAVPYIG